MYICTPFRGILQTYLKPLHSWTVKTLSYRRIFWQISTYNQVKAIPTQKLIRALAKKNQTPKNPNKNKQEKHIIIWFRAGQKLYYASHFLYVKHIAVAGQTHLSKLASFLSYTSVSERWTQKSHHLNKCHVTWQLCLWYMIIWEA